MVPERFPGPVLPRTDAEFDRYYAQRSAWTRDFNEKGFDARFLPGEEFAFLGGQFHIPPRNLREAVEAASIVVIGSVQNIDYVGDGFGDYVLAVDEYLKGEGPSVLDFRGVFPAVEAIRQSDGSLISGKGKVVGPPVFEGDRVIMNLQPVASPDGTTTYHDLHYGSFIKIELGRVKAPGPSFPDELNGLTLSQLLERIRAAASD
jgi:hypothetical protein